jgi:putative tryptophan/tyrosine transport system substrate-binding protein
MRRRELVLLLGGATFALRTVCAEQKAMPLIGFIGSSSPVRLAPHLAAFHHGLSEAGYVEGKMYMWNTVGRKAALSGCLH